MLQIPPCSSFWQSADFNKAITGLVSTLAAILGIYLWQMKNVLVSKLSSASQHAAVAAQVGTDNAQKLDTVVIQTDGLNKQLQVKLDAQTAEAQHEAIVSSLQTEIAVLKKNGGTTAH